MKALILNSGTGSRMGDLTKRQPKCMTEIAPGETILSRQLRQLAAAGIGKVVITTGFFDKEIVEHCRAHQPDMQFTFVRNERYAQTNYIYSIELARQAVLDTDLLLLHGDLVFADTVLRDMLSDAESRVAVSTTVPLPEKDFKAVLRQGRVESIGIEFFTDAVALQPLYKLKRESWQVWLHAIGQFCAQGQVKCYAEAAFNAVSADCPLFPWDVRDSLCNEIDTIEDLEVIKGRVHHGE